MGDDELTRLARDVFPIKPGEIVAHLDLKKPRYRQTLRMVILDASLNNSHGKKPIWWMPY